MIYHITTDSKWEKAREAGSYLAPSLETEGFIHCSTRDQVLHVANAFYRGEDDLVLLCLDDVQLASTLKWEAPAHPNPENAPDTDEAAKFPHIYGPIGLQAIVKIVRFPEGEEGFRLPPDLPE